MKLTIILSVVVVAILLLRFKFFEKRIMTEEKTVSKMTDSLSEEPIKVRPEVVLPSSNMSVEEAKYEVILSMAKIPGVANDPINSKMKALANQILNKEAEFPFSDDMKNPEIDGELRGIMAGILQFEIFQLGSKLINEIIYESTKNEDRPVRFRQFLALGLSQWAQDNKVGISYLTELGEMEEILNFPT